MAEILLTWELGAGLGHLTRLLPIAQAFQANGHSITLAARDLTHVRSLFGALPRATFQAPLRHSRPRNPILKSASFSQVLHNVGYDDANILQGLLTAWQAILNAVNPQLLIADHSPTALLAARGRKLKTAAIGGGFEFPKPGRPFTPFLDPLSGQQLGALLATDDAMLENTNTALRRLQLPAIRALHDIYAGLDEACFLTLAELDHYGAREGVDYLGIRGMDGGQPAQWPELDAPKIYAYLKPFPKLPEFLALLKTTALNVLIYNNNLPRQLVAAHSAANVSFVDRPLDLRQVADQAALAIVNANHATTGTLLLSGLPCLMIPLQAEQALLAGRVTRLGAGIAVNAMDEHNIMAGLKHMLARATYRKVARKFSRKYRDFDVAGGERRMLSRLRNLLTES